MSSASLPAVLPLARRDLQAVPTHLRGRRFWTIKDPLTLRYFQLRDEEHFLWGLLDGEHSLEQIITEFEQRHSPRRLRSSELSGFLMLLHREGLVVATTWGQGAQLAQRGEQRLWQQRLSQFTNVLAIQLPACNPDRFLTALVPHLRWIFSAWFLTAVVMLFGAAAVLVAVNFSTLVARLPHFREFLSAANLVWLAVALALVKSLHELGHAVACKHWGGECNRLGLMLLVFTPALYCDVSDAWMFPCRWQRIAVSAAGMALELVLASLAVILWATTEPGWFNAICLNIVVVCSVGTLLINGNPLLRYDGYYIVADLLDAPNLRQQASAAISRGLAQLWAGVTLEQPRLLAEPWLPLLWAYGLGAAVYRALVLIAILWLVHATLAPYGLAIVAQFVTLITLAAMVTAPATRGGRWLRDPAHRKLLRPRRLILTTLGLAVVVAALLLVPLPSRVTAPVVLRPQHARRIYVTTPGRLISVVPAGAHVEAGQEIGRLKNTALERQVETLASRCDAQRLHRTHLQLQRHDDESQGDQLPAAAKLLADLEAQLQQQKAELERLTLTAPMDGTILSPVAHSARQETGELAMFAGTPLDEPNRGCKLEAGTLVCLVGDPERLEGVAIIDEATVPRIGVRQRVRLRLVESPGMVLYGRIAAVSQLNSDELPPEVIARQLVPHERRPDGSVSSVGTYYEAVIAMDVHAADAHTTDAHTVPLLLNATGWARIEVAPQPLWLHLYRGLRSTFRWAL